MLAEQDNDPVLGLYLVSFAYFSERCYKVLRLGDRPRVASGGFPSVITSGLDICDYEHTFGSINCYKIAWWWLYGPKRFFFFFSSTSKTFQSKKVDFLALATTLQFIKSISFFYLTVRLSLTQKCSKIGPGSTVDNSTQLSGSPGSLAMTPWLDNTCTWSILQSDLSSGPRVPSQDRRLGGSSAQYYEGSRILVFHSHTPSPLLLESYDFPRRSWCPRGSNWEPCGALRADHTLEVRKREHTSLTKVTAWSGGTDGFTCTTYTYRVRGV